MNRDASLLSFRNPVLLAGIPLFFLSYVTERSYHLPAAEFFFVGLILFGLASQRGWVRTHSGIGAALLSIIMVAWMTLVDAYHGNTLGHNLRVLTRTGTFYLLIFGYMLLPNKQSALRLMTGYLVGYLLNFYYMTVLEFAHGGADSLGWLKMVLPTPAVVLFLLFFRRHLSRAMRWFLISYLLFSLVTMPLIHSRGAFLSLFVGLCFCVLARLRFIPRTFFIILALMLPFVSIIVIGTMYEPDNPYVVTDRLFAHDYGTLSNVERTLMINHGIDVMLNEPVFGIATEQFLQDVSPYYTTLTRERGMAAESPHNYYMELSVPYGIPALAMALVVWFFLYRLLFASAKQGGMCRGIAAFCCGVIGWMMLYQPISSFIRMEVFAMMFFGMYGLKGRAPDLKPTPGGES